MIWNNTNSARYHPCAGTASCQKELCSDPYWRMLTFILVTLVSPMACERTWIVFDDLATTAL